MEGKRNDDSKEEFTSLETLKVRREGAVLFVEIDAPPMNLMGPGMVKDMVTLIQKAEADQSVQILVFTSAIPEYFISHVDVTTVKENREAAIPLNGEASLGMLLYHLSNSRLISIAQVEGRTRGIGSEFILACDMRFAALESALFGQFEIATGVIPGAGGVQHLTRLLGRGRALEVMLSADDYNAEIAERYGWINRAMSRESLGEFVNRLAHRIAAFPEAGRRILKERVNAISLARADEIRRDSDLFMEGATDREFRDKLQAAMKQGFQTREGEMDLGVLMGDLP